MGTHFQKNSEIAANSKHFPSSFWKKLNVFLCNFFAIKWEFDKMGMFFRISCYFGAKWEPILSRAYCIASKPEIENHIVTLPVLTLVLKIWIACTLFRTMLGYRHNFQLTSSILPLLSPPASEFVSKNTQTRSAVLESLLN